MIQHDFLTACTNRADPPYGVTDRDTITHRTLE